MRQRLIPVAVMVMFTAPELGAQELPSAMAKGIDSIFAAYSSAGGPGCAVGVYQNGTTTFARGYGLANITNEVQIGRASCRERV